MKLFGLFILIFCIKSVSPFAFLALIGNINTVISLVDFAGRTLGIFEKEEAGPTGVSEDRIIQVLDSVIEVANRMDEIAESVDIKLTGISKKLSKMQHMQKLSKAQDELSIYVNRIDELYEEFLAYSAEPDSFNKETIEEFIGVITGHNNLALGNTLNRMHALFVPKRSAAIRGSILNFVLGIQNIDSEFSCNNPESIQQYIIELYSMVVISELKGFMIVDFAYTTLSAYDNRPFTKEKNKAQSQVLMRTTEYLNSTRSAMGKASRKYVRCNPSAWKEGTNYFEMKQLFQGYLIGQDQAKTTCAKIDTAQFEKCHKFQKSDYDKVLGIATSKVIWKSGEYCMKQKCRGYVSQCIQIGSPTVCEMGDRSRIRYQYVENLEKEVWGKKSDCTNGTEEYVATATESGRNFMCLCECAEMKADSQALRSFSMLPVQSDIKDNMVITGIRISNKFNIVHLEIEQGKLGDNARIQDNSTKWQPPPKYEYKPEGDYGKWSVIHSNGTKREMVFKYDYTSFWAHQKTLNLDDIFAPKDHVITGVKFSLDESESKVDKWWPRMPLQLSIQITPANITSGKLTNDKPSKWIKPEEMENKSQDYSRKRSRVNVKDTINPLSSTREQARDSTTNQLVDFQMTSLKEDVGSHTIPFIDMQEVSPLRKSPLDGIGFFHKGAPGSGGFVALQVFHIDFVPFMQATMTPENLNIFKNKTAGSDVKLSHSERRKNRG